MHSICLSTDSCKTKMVSKFSSLKKIDTFTKGNLSVEICASRLRLVNDSYRDIVDTFEEFFDLVHSKGGQTVYGWCKRGVTNDVSILGNDIKDPGDNKVLSQYISTNVVPVHPSMKDYIDLSKIHGRSLDNLKFDFLTL